MLVLGITGCNQNSLLVINRFHYDVEVSLYQVLLVNPTEETCGEGEVDTKHLLEDSLTVKTDDSVYIPIFTKDFWQPEDKGDEEVITCLELILFPGERDFSSGVFTWYEGSTCVIAVRSAGEDKVYCG